MERFEFSKFIKVKTFVTDREYDAVGDIRTYISSRACINPMSISYYSPLKFEQYGVKYDVTVVMVGSIAVWVDVPFNEFDKFFDEIQRGIDIKEDN